MRLLSRLVSCLSRSSLGTPSAARCSRGERRQAAPWGVSPARPRAIGLGEAARADGMPQLHRSPPERHLHCKLRYPMCPSNPTQLDLAPPRAHGMPSQARPRSALRHILQELRGGAQTICEAPSETHAIGATEFAGLTRERPRRLGWLPSHRHDLLRPTALALAEHERGGALNPARWLVMKRPRSTTARSLRYCPEQSDIRSH